MSSSGSFQGLQFRILEVLEKQPRQAPLTALEIADILHSGEYRNEMKDNVVFKVSRAVHSMREQGKIVVSDARDREGRLCYQLPQRLRFPPKVTDKPTNPVLTPEIAAQVQTVEPKPEPTGRRPRPLYVPGIQQKIVETLDKAPHPMTTADFARELGPLYGDNVPAKNLTTLFSGSLHHLAKNKRSIFRRRVKGYGTGVTFEYFTRNTGTEPHPLSKKPAPKPQAQIEPPLERAPLPSQAWKEPTPMAPNRETHRQETDEEIQPTPARSALFRPVSAKQRTEVISARVPVSKYRRIEHMAQKFDVSIAEFVVQAVDFALEHAETEES